jgi:hypothetical protein
MGRAGKRPTSERGLLPSLPTGPAPNSPLGECTGRVAVKHWTSCLFLASPSSAARGRMPKFFCHKVANMTCYYSHGVWQQYPSTARSPRHGLTDPKGARPPAGPSDDGLAGVAGESRRAGVAGGPRRGLVASAGQLDARLTTEAPEAAWRRPRGIVVVVPGAVHRRGVWCVQAVAKPRRQVPGDLAARGCVMTTAPDG